MTNEEMEAKIIELETKLNSLLSMASAEQVALEIVNGDAEYQEKMKAMALLELEARAVNLEIEKTNQEINLLNQQKLLTAMKESI
jgi:hypothetical protein